MAKNSPFDVEIGGVTVKTSVIESAEFIDSKISELRFPCLRRPIVGIDVKYCNSNHSSTSDSGSKSSTASLLILCVDKRCLIIQLACFGSLPGPLVRFFNDETITFAGIEIDSKLGSTFESSYNCKVKTKLDLGDLAARRLRKPEHSGGSFGLADLARAVRLNSLAAAVELPPGTSSSHDISWIAARDLTDDQMKVAIHEAYTCYCVGNLLHGTLAL